METIKSNQPSANTAYILRRIGAGDGDLVGVFANYLGAVKRAKRLIETGEQGFRRAYAVDRAWIDGPGVVRDITKVADGVTDVTGATREELDELLSDYTRHNVSELISHLTGEVL